MPGVERGTQVCATISHLEQVSRGIPAIEITVIAYRQINPPDEGSRAVNDQAFLVERLRDMEDRAAALVQAALNACYGTELLLLAEGIVDQPKDVAQSIGIPQQDPYVNPTPCGEAEYIQHPQPPLLPEGYGLLIQSLGPQALKQHFLLWSAWLSGTLVSPAHEFKLCVQVPID